MIKKIKQQDKNQILENLESTEIGADPLAKLTNKDEEESTENSNSTNKKGDNLPFIGKDSLILGQLQRLDTAIHKEYTLVSDRMSWMVTSESFMFTAFILAATNYKNANSLKPLVICFLILMPILGMFIIIIVRLAINAAHAAANRLKDDRDKLEINFTHGGVDISIKPISSKDIENHAGNLPATYVPFAFMIVWAILFVVVVILIP